MQRAVVQLQPSHHAGAKIFDQDIGVGDKPADDFDRVRRFQIENEAFLADIELAEGGAEQPLRTGGRVRIVSPSAGLDLDDLRAHVGEHPRAMRAGNRGRKIEHAKALKALCQIPLIVSPLSSFRKLPVHPWPRRDPKLRGYAGEAILGDPKPSARRLPGPQFRMSSETGTILA